MERHRKIAGLIPSRLSGHILASVSAVVFSVAVLLASAPTARAATRFDANFSPAHQIKGFSAPLQVEATDRFLFVLDGNAIRVHDRSLPNAGVSAYGETGKGEGFFFVKPQGMALSPSGDILAVADTGNNRVQLFSVKGSGLTFKKAFGYTSPTNPIPPPDGTFIGPKAVSFSGKGDLLVADAGNHRIQRFSSEGDHLATYPIVRAPISIAGVSADEDDTGFWVSLQGRGSNHLVHYIYVADTVEIDNFYDTGSTVNPDSAMSGERVFSSIRALKDGYIAACDWVSGEAMILATPKSLDKGPVCFFGGRSSAGGKNARLSRPGGLAFRPEENRLYVADTGNGRVVWFDITENTPPAPPPEVELHGSVYPEGVVPGPAGVGLAKSTTVRFDCSRENVCAKETSVLDVAVTKDLVYALAGHGQSAPSALSYIAVYDRAQPSKELARYSTFTDGSGKTMHFSSPSGIELNPAGDLLAVVDTFGDRILLFTVSGESLVFKQAIEKVVLFATSSESPAAISPTFLRPRAASFAKNNDLIIADTGHFRVVRIRAGAYETADSYAIGEASSAFIEDVCFDSVDGRDGFWVVDSPKNVPPYLAFYPFESAVPSIVSPKIFEHPVDVSVWNDGTTNRMAVLDKNYSALLFFQLLPEGPEMRLCSLAGSAFTTNSCTSPSASATRLWRNENLWHRTEEGGQVVFTPSELMGDNTEPKLQNPTGFDIYTEGGASVIYVADMGHSRIVWYGCSIEGTESGGVKPEPPARMVRWPFSSIEFLPVGDGAAGGQKVLLGWEAEILPAAAGDKLFKIDYAEDLNGSWRNWPDTFKVPAASGQGQAELDLPGPASNRHFFKLWWMNSPAGQP